MGYLDIQLRKDTHAPKIIAECGANHGGSIDVAKEMVRVASECGADYAKFQVRDVESIPDSVKSRQRSDAHSFGPTEYAHRKALELSHEQHATLKEYCEAVGIGYAASAWDEASYNFLVDLGCEYIKIPSAKNVAWEKWKRNGKHVELHISLGMLTGGERDRLLRDHGVRGIGPDVLFYACTSKYPCQSDETYLLEVSYITQRCGRSGFSGHHNGIALDVGAYLLGADWIERHFTLDRTAKGTDHAASLEPQGFAKLARDIQAVRSALKAKPGQLPTHEIESFRKFKGE